MRKSVFCKIFAIFENEGTDQLHVSCVVTVQLIGTFVFATDITNPLLSKSEILTIFCGFTPPFLSVHVGNPEDRSSQDMAHLTIYFNLCQYKAQGC